MAEFETSRKIEFVDTDQGGIVHFSRFFVFMETAEHRFLESRGTSVDTEHDGRKIGWPRVAARCEYKSPAKFGDTLTIVVKIERAGRSSMSYGFRFLRDGEEIAAGAMTSVCCVLEPGKSVRSIPIPEEIAAKLRCDS